MRELTDLLLTKYYDLLNNLNMGYPLNEKDVNKVWELVHIIDCVRFGILNHKELNKIFKHYE